MSRTILMLEPDEDDRYFTKSIFEENLYDIRLEFVTSSQDLFAHLYTCEKKHTQYPSIILLNYYSAPQNAIDILNQLKSDTPFRHIPVIVLSGTLNDGIVQDCYAAGANSFIQKPSLSSESQEKISKFIEYWFKTVELPA